MLIPKRYQTGSRLKGAPDRDSTDAIYLDSSALLAGLDLIPLSGAVIDQAADVGETTLRGLDAIYLASALSIQAELTALLVPGA